MAVPKTTQTRCRDGSVQARQVIIRLHKQPHPSSFLFLQHGIDVQNSHSMMNPLGCQIRFKNIMISIPGLPW